MEDMSKCTDPEYCAMFPRAEDRLDLPAIARLCHRGRYDDDPVADSASAGVSGAAGRKGAVSGAASRAAKGTNSVGIGALFEDLARMVANSKAFNACNAHFLPWRMAHMMECAVLGLKARLAREHGIPSLLHSLQRDQEDLQEQRASSMAVEM